MDKELESYYEERFSMTGSKGWKDLMEDVDVMIANVSHIKNITSDTNTDFRKGQYDILLWLKNLRHTAEMAYDKIKQGEEDESL